MSVPAPLTALRAALRDLPRYWVKVTDRPIAREVPCHMATDIERVIAMAMAGADLTHLDDMLAKWRVRAAEMETCNQVLFHCIRDIEAVLRGDWPRSTEGW